MDTGSLYVEAGGAKFYENSLTELSNLGYSTNYPGMKDISEGADDSMPTVPVNGTVLRSGGGQIYVVAGGAKFVFASWSEYTSQGYASSSYTTVPQAPLDAIGDAPGNMPMNGTVVDAPDGSLYVIAGGVKWQFGSMSQYTSLGYSSSQIVYVSQAPINGIAAASATNLPANGTLLQESGSTVYIMQSGELYYFQSTAQFNADGYSWSSIVRVPDSILSTIPSGGALP